jgi:protein-disulfide isomerase
MNSRLLWLATIVGVALVQPAMSFGQSPTRPSDAVATVDGSAVTESDLHSSGGLPLSRIAQQFYEARAEALDALIARRLMAAEAQRRGVSLTEFERLEIDSKCRPVSDTDVELFYSRNRERIRGDASEARVSIRAYLEQQRRSVRRALLVAELRAASNVEIHLTAPPAFRVRVNTEGAPIRGGQSAVVTIVEFSDFHCPFCQRVQPTLAELLAKYSDRVRLVYKHSPLEGLHPNARRVSEAAWCAGTQNRFWEFHDAGYAGSSSEASDEALARFAAAAGLDVPRFASCVGSADAQKAVQQDVVEAEALGVRSTPAFFVNGREVQGAQPLEVFERVIEEELRLEAPPATSASGNHRLPE